VLIKQHWMLQLNWAPHGGWIPKGRMTENGPLPDKYDLIVNGVFPFR